MAKAKHTEQAESYGLSRYFLLTMTLSLMGWGFETLLMLVLYGRFYDRGFMTMPFCPIYGGSLLAMYLLAGTPDEGRGLLKNVDNRAKRYLLYYLIAFIVPSAAELIVGFFFDKGFNVWLWSYSGMPLNLGGYVCVPVSIAWATMIFFFMKFIFLLFKRLFKKLPTPTARTFATVLLIATVIDLVYNFVKI